MPDVSAIRRHQCQWRPYQHGVTGGHLGSSVVDETLSVRRVRREDRVALQQANTASPSQPASCLPPGLQKDLAVIWVPASTVGHDCSSLTGGMADSPGPQRERRD